MATKEGFEVKDGYEGGLYAKEVATAESGSLGA